MCYFRLYFDMWSNYGKRSRDFSLPWHLTMVFLCTENLSFDGLFSKALTWSIQLRCSSSKIPRNLIERNCIISYSFIFIASNRSGRLSLSWDLRNSVNLVLSSFRDNLFVQNRSDTVSSSKFAFTNNGFIYLFEDNKLVSSANMIGFKNCDMKLKSFI